MEGEQKAQVVTQPEEEELVQLPPQLVGVAGQNKVTKLKAAQCLNAIGYIQRRRRTESQIPQLEDFLKKLLENTPKPGMPKNAAATAMNPVAFELCRLLPLQRTEYITHRVYPEYLFDEEDTENEHYQHFMKLVEESRGYYIPKVPEGVKISYPWPSAFPPHKFDFLEQRARDALGWYNKEKKEEETFELEKVECGTQIPLGALVCLIAFIARGSVSGVEQPFRAKVLYGVGGVVTVESCEKVTESCEKFTRFNGRCCEMVNQTSS